MRDLTPLLHDPKTTMAIIGATDTPGKYGGIIYRDMKSRGYRVYAVNPNRSTVDGDACWARVTDLPETPDVAVFVVPADKGLQVLEDCAEAGIQNVWVQPGAFSTALGEALDQGGFEWLAEACVMVRAPRSVVA